MVHVDVKKLDRIPGGSGWRVHGRSSDAHRASKRQPRPATPTCTPSSTTTPAWPTPSSTVTRPQPSQPTSANERLHCSTRRASTTSTACPATAAGPIAPECSIRLQTARQGLRWGEDAGRCQGECGSAKNTLVPVSSANWAWPDSSFAVPGERLAELLGQARYRHRQRHVHRDRAVAAQRCAVCAPVGS